MEDRRPTLWGVIWMAVALVGMVGVMKGDMHHISTLVIGTVMLIVSEDRKERK